MDHEVVPRPYSICDWLLKSSQDDFSVPRKKCQSDHGIRGPQKTSFKASIIHWHGSIDFAVGEAKELL